VNNDGKGRSTRPVCASASLGLNYVFHLLAVARVGFDSDYADRYAATLMAKDRVVLDEHRDLLTFGMGSAARLCDYFFWFPSFLNLNTRGEFEIYVNLVVSCIRDSDFGPFIKRYDVDFQALNLWWQTVEADSLLDWKDDRDTIGVLGQVLLRNLKAYLRSVWPAERPRLLDIKGRIERHFRTADYIRRWEEITGLSFKTPEFRVELCAAIENGPNANSISYDRVMFYSETPFPKMLHFISHEIGTHILIDLLKEQRQSGRFPWPELYAACETLAKFYNTLVIGEEQLAYDMSAFRDSERVAVYRKLYREHPAWSPSELLVAGLEAVGYVTKS
jgi:hypothetical protein